MRIGTMKSPRAIAAVLALGALVTLASASFAQTRPPSAEAMHILHRLHVLEPRVPEAVVEELKAYAGSWERLGWDDKQFLEKSILRLESMLPFQIEEYFKPAGGLSGDEKRKKIKSLLEKLVQGAEIPAQDIQPSVVVVVVGGGVSDTKVGFGDPKKENLPRIWNEIRPFGTFVKSIRTMWVADRTRWMGEFLTGIPVNAIIPDGNVWKFKVPTVFDLFRKISGEEARFVWLVSRGPANVIYDFLDLVPSFKNQFSPTAVTRAKLNAIDLNVQEHILSERKEGKSPFKIQRSLGQTLSASKLHLDVDFPNPGVQAFLKDVVAEHGGQLTDSDAFLLRLGVRLLQDPRMAPRFAVFRFSAVQGLDEVKRTSDKRAMMAAKMRDDDEACYNLWRAFRSNPYYKQMGTFVVVNEVSGAVFVGPKIKVGGEVTKGYYLNQFPATLARLLGFETDAFFAPSRGGKKEPIEDIFREE